MHAYGKRRKEKQTESQKGAGAGHKVAQGQVNGKR